MHPTVLWLPTKFERTQVPEHSRKRAGEGCGYWVLGFWVLGVGQIAIPTPNTQHPIPAIPSPRPFRSIPEAVKLNLELAGRRLFLGNQEGRKVRTSQGTAPRATGGPDSSGTESATETNRHGESGGTEERKSGRTEESKIWIQLEFLLILHASTLPLSLRQG